MRLLDGSALNSYDLWILRIHKHEAPAKESFLPEVIKLVWNPCRIYRAAVPTGGYWRVRDSTKAILKKATGASAFWRLGWDFRAALWTRSECASHYGRVARALPLFTAQNPSRGYARPAAIKSRSSSCMAEHRFDANFRHHNLR